MKRNQAVEALRVLSALGVVWFHAAIWGSYYAYAGFVVFVILTAYFEAARPDDRQRTVLDVARRLLLPWLIWFTIYVLLNLGRHHVVIDADEGVLAGILLGSGQHLWYLPFAFAMLSLTVLCRRAVSGEVLGYGAAALAALGLLTMSLWWPQTHAMILPYGLYFGSAIPFLLGLVLGSVDRMRFGWAIVAVLLALTVTAIWGPNIDALNYAIATVAVIVATRLLPRFMPSGFQIGWLAQAMFGVYLVQAVFLKLAQPLTARFEIPSVLLIFALSTLTVLVVKWKFPRLGATIFG